MELGGAEYNLLDLIHDIDKTLIVPHVIGPANSELRSRLAPHKDVVFYSHLLQRVNPLKGLGNIISYIKGVTSLTLYIKNNIDIVHTCSYRGTLYGLIAGKLARKKTVWHVHDIHRSFFFRKLIPMLADQIIVVSDAVGEQFSPNIRKNKINVIYNGVDLNNYRPNDGTGTIKNEIGLNNNNLLLGAVGRLAQWKGFHHIIDSLPAVLQHFPDTHLVIAGDAILTSNTYKKRLIDLVYKKGLTEQVHFLGQRTDIPNVMRSLDLFISFSKDEPFGRVITEAMAMETPVIVADSGGAPEIIKDVDCGLIVKTGDSSELAKSIIEILSLSHARRLTIGENGRKKVLKTFDSSDISRKVLLVYDKISDSDEVFFSKDEKRQTNYQWGKD